MNRPLNEAAAEKIRQYRADYNNRPSNVISFMSVIPSTSDRLHSEFSEFVFLLFLRTHLETDRFLADSGVQLTQFTSGQFHYRRVSFSSHLKSKVGNILVKTEAFRITLNLDGEPISYQSDT